MCATLLEWHCLVNAYGVKTGWFIPFVDRRVDGRQNCVIPLTRAIPEHIRGGYDDAPYKLTFTTYFCVCWENNLWT